VKTRETSREIFSEDDKLLNLRSTCTITFCEEFPELVGTDILCKQFFLFPERYVEFFVGNPVQITLPYKRVEDYVKNKEEYLNVTMIEIDVYEMMHE
jgi:hypothetical protein